MAEKEAEPDDYREQAKSAALFDLASQISVDIAGSFVDVAVERTGLSEQEVRMEISASSQARLTGHEMVDEWETNKAYGVYYRLSKEKYHRQIDLERETVTAAAADMALDLIRREEIGHRGGGRRGLLRSAGELRAGVKYIADVEGRLRAGLGTRQHG